MARFTCPCCGEELELNATDICSIIDLMRKEFETELNTKVQEYEEKIIGLEAQICELQNEQNDLEDELEQSEENARHFRAQANRYRGRSIL